MSTRREQVLVGRENAPIQTGQIVGEQDKTAGRSILRLGDDEIKTWHGEKEAKDRQNDRILGESCPYRSCCGGATTSGGMSVVTAVCIIMNHVQCSQNTVGSHEVGLSTMSARVKALTNDSTYCTDCR